jgi:3-oxoadipate enol-lactonase
MKTTVRDGAEIEYTLHPGAAGAPRLLLVHSLALDRSVWDGVAAALGDDAEILALDCRGHGASTKAPGPYTLERFADDLADLMQAVGWERAFIAGSSMGGSVVLRFATRYPALVAGVALIDTTAWYGPEAPKNWEERAARAESEGLGALVDFQETRWFSDAFRAAHPEVVARARAIFLRNDVPSYAATCRMLGNFDLRAAATTIGCPAEILVGEEDYATPPAMARELEAAIRGVHLRVVPGVRHLTTLEIPELVAATIRALLAEGATSEAVGGGAR